MLDRKVVLQIVLTNLGETDFLVSALGFISRDLYALTGSLREHCFYCLGSMGSVTPFALGISLGKPQANVFALEGDGSLLMNLGSLVTVRRYGRANVRLIVFDNGCYESTGGQPSQPQGFKLDEMCRASGLHTSSAEDVEDILAFMRLRDIETPSILVVKVGLSPASPRVDEDPKLISARFSRYLHTLSPIPAVPTGDE